jgi:hypothetical protein
MGGKRPGARAAALRECVPVPGRVVAHVAATSKADCIYNLKQLRQLIA